MAELFSEHKDEINTILVNDGQCKRFFVHGPPGTSKSFTIESLLKDNNYIPVILDAAAAKQNMLELLSFVDKVMWTAAMFGIRKCLLVDNIRGDYVEEQDRDTNMVIEVLSTYLTGGKIQGWPELKAPTSHNLLVVIADCNISQKVKGLSKLMKTFHFKPYNIQMMNKIAHRIASLPPN